MLYFVVKYFSITAFSLDICEIIVDIVVWEKLTERSSEMGVLQCDRKDCENIMCYRHSAIYGYICGECFEELVASKTPIEVFMEKSKTCRGNSQFTREYYEDVFK